MDLNPGIHPHILFADYINDPCPEPSLSKGVIGDLIERSPLHVYHSHPRLGGRTDSNSNRADLGSAAHELVLGGDDRIVWIDAADFRTKAAKEERDVAHAQLKIPMLEKQREQLEAMAQVGRDRLCEFGAGHSELTMVWESDGIWYRSKPDWLSKDRLLAIDYKTATNADPLTWIRSVLMRSHYDIQGALALQGLYNLEGPAQREFLFLVQEIEAPYACSVVGIGPQMLELAERKIAAASRVWKRCMQEKSWPGYQHHIHWAELPEYKTWDFENRSACYEGGE